MRSRSAQASIFANCIERSNDVQALGIKAANNSAVCCCVGGMSSQPDNRQSHSPRLMHSNKAVACD